MRGQMWVLESKIVRITNMEDYVNSKKFVDPVRSNLINWLNSHNLQSYYDSEEGTVY